VLKVSKSPFWIFKSLLAETEGVELLDEESSSLPLSHAAKADAPEATIKNERQRARRFFLLFLELVFM
jgi:hypothetical protein